MLDLLTTAFGNIDYNLHRRLVLINFKNAFATVCHKILLNWPIMTFKAEHLSY